ncbi:hypothetical protein PLICRDRAFT_120018 [Plicaturopsis crispa FD-325 SS-3]|uniref:HAT C-terminal dimerisation domain-containing protein n=1 Tax=Plicaturopsis crispa FD-325 SS-3 TaxID=944288 RepID=A0A0C9SPS9_PLICR|nr:hypothetical protein PLICRDRAFT_120018 [Plicaturopsis crispa FD-325 SS-3]
MFQAQKFKFPLLYRVALDVMPVQASAVPCERVFSSSKATDTDQRNSLSPVMMEMLQILKYWLGRTASTLLTSGRPRKRSCGSWISTPLSCRI